MVTRFFSHAFSRHLATGLLFLSAMVSGLLVTGKSHAENRVDETALPTDSQLYQGTVNFVHEDSFKLIIDDHSFILDRVLRFSNGSWSREQVIQRIEQGDLVKMELGGTLADYGSFTRAVRSITVIDR